MDRFVELRRIENLMAQAPAGVHTRILTQVTARGLTFPIYAFEIGSRDPQVPVLGLFGGVHGLERVGTHVVLAYLESLFAQLKWDHDLLDRFKECRLLAMPLINPAGMFFGSRSNANGIDLMRNAPVEAEGETPFLLGGHRISTKLPWYRGAEGAAMEPEAKALVDFVKERVFPSSAAITLDIHSGFGMKDRLWYPYAKSEKPFPRIEEVENIRRLLDQTYPNHIYAIEPQSLSYTTHGDLWDYLFDEHSKEFGTQGRVFIPWTLEIGSWLWVRKNPLQLFSALGPFNPVKEHRHRRTMRRHLPLLDFMLRAARNHMVWRVERKAT